MTMDLVARKDADFTPDQRALLAAWGQDAFGDQAWTADYSWASPEWGLLLMDADEPVSYLKIVTRTGTAGGSAIRLGGIGSVMTPTPLRGRGHASELVRRAAGFMFDELGVDLGMLLCLPGLLPFYGALGWTEVRSPVWIEHPERGRIRWPEGAMVLPRAGTAWHDAEIDVRGLPW
jgi:hypothetical protein